MSRHLVYIPFTGLGLYNGFRGNQWLRNRIKVFEQFVVPSLQAQTTQNFTIWVSWRRKERSNKQVQSLYHRLVNIFGPLRVVFTYNGVCFWDDKYENAIAHERLITSLHNTIPELVDYIGDVHEVLMTIQPSDDCYYEGAFEQIQRYLKDPELDAVGYKHGYITDYKTKEVREYNPKTNPPFFTIKFKKETFIDPFQHMKFTGPYESHEYVGDHLRYKQIDKRGFLVGTHGENISTYFNIPYAGTATELQGFDWYAFTPPIAIRYNLRKRIMRSLPHKMQRKLRYWFGELLLNKLYKWKSSFSL